MDIAKTSFVVVDTETTGTSASNNRIIEIGAVRVLEGAIVDEYSQLIHPGQQIPAHITRLTRITNGMVYGMPRVEQVLPSFIDFLGDGILVAHNLSFDMGFLNAELARAELPAIDNTSLCTLRLARRLLKGLRSKGLSALAAFYGIKIKGRHRALGDAKATAEVLTRFLERLADENAIFKTDDLIKFQFTSYAPKKGTRKRLVELRDTRVPEIPPKPGVYLFKGKKGQVIYVGKAKSLNSRVRSYFTSIEAHSSHTRKLIERIHTIDWKELDSELEALIEESRLIKTLKPRYNRAQKKYRNRPFIRLSMQDTYPKVTLSSYLVEDGSEYFGPIGSKRQASMILDLINRFFLLRECDEGTFQRGKACLYTDIKRCPAPCKQQITPEDYAIEVGRVRAFLIGAEMGDIMERLHASMVSASVEMDYELAAAYRDQGELVTSLMARQECIASPVLQHNAVVIDRSVDDGLWRLLFIRHGRLLETQIVSARPTDFFRPSVFDALHRCFEEEQEAQIRYYKAEIEEVRLLAHWLYVHRDEVVKYDYQPGESIHSFGEALWQQLITLPDSKAEQFSSLKKTNLFSD